MMELGLANKAIGVNKGMGLEVLQMDVITVVFLALVLVADGNYVVKAWRKETAPVVTTWLLFATGATMSLVTSLKFGGSLTGNIANTLDVPICWTILGVVVWRSTVEMIIDPFDVKCMGVTGLISIGWTFTQSHFWSNLALQAVMTIAFFPTFKKLWDAEKNTETYVTWIAICISSVLALVIAAGKSEILSLVYAGRATVMTSIIIALMIRLDYMRR